MHLRIKTDNITLWSNYENHNSYHLGDSGLDLFTPEDIIVPAGAISFKVDLRIQCEAYSDKNKSLSISYYLYPRSSMGAKTPLRLANSVGIIDAGYRGNIIGIVDNHSKEDFRIEPTMKNSKKFSNWILKGETKKPNLYDAKRIHLIINKMLLSSKKKSKVYIN